METKQQKDKSLGKMKHPALEEERRSMLANHRMQESCEERKTNEDFLGKLFDHTVDIFVGKLPFFKIISPQESTIWLVLYFSTFFHLLYIVFQIIVFKLKQFLFNCLRNMPFSSTACLILISSQKLPHHLIIV